MSGSMAAAIAEAGFTLHVWARRAASLLVLADVPHVVYDTLAAEVGVDVLDVPVSGAHLEEVVAVADGLGMDVPALVELLKAGSAASFTLSALNDAITVDNAGHLREVELLDMKLFAAAMAERDADAEAVTGRGVSGAEGLVDLINRDNPR
jgi:3-hydroxyisobutyrate dehydrogenase-like beta-hydroxyacid dehydrogenase